MLWTDKYAPTSIQEFAGNSDIAEAMIKWAILWKNDKKQRPVLLCGAPGVGKTTLAYVLAKQMDWDVVETNASNLRDKESINRVIGAASSCYTLTGKMRLVLIDEVDGMQRSDRGGASAIYQIIKTSSQPIILTANDGWAMNIRELRSLCTIYDMKKVNSRTIEGIFKKIIEKEEMEYNEEVAKKIAVNSEGDLRAALFDLQAVYAGRKKVKIEDLAAIGERLREKDIFKAMQLIFKSMDYKRAKSALDGLDMDFDMLVGWIDENIPNEYEENEDAAKAFDRLSRADVYRGRIMKRQSWVFLKFAMDMATAGVALAKKEPYHKFTRYYFPTIIRKLSLSKENRAKEKEVCGKISEKSHVSVRDAKWIYLPLIKLIAERNLDAFSKMCQFYGLFDVEEIAFLLEKKITDKEVEEITEKIGKTEETVKKRVKEEKEDNNSINQFF